MRSICLKQQQHLHCHMWPCLLPASGDIHAVPATVRVRRLCSISKRRIPAAVVSPLKQAHGTSSTSGAVASTAAADSRHGHQQPRSTVDIEDEYSCYRVEHRQPMTMMPAQQKQHTPLHRAGLTESMLPKILQQEALGDAKPHLILLHQQHQESSTCMQQPFFAQPPPPALNVSQDVTVVATPILQPRVQHHERVWRPKWKLSKVVSIAGVCRMLQQHAHDLSPVQWVSAYSRVVHLVSQGQSVPAQGWHQLRQGIRFLTTCDGGMMDVLPVSSEGPAHLHNISKSKGGQPTTAAHTPAAGHLAPADCSSVEDTGTSGMCSADQQQQRQLRSRQQHPLCTGTDSADQQLSTAPISRFSSRQLCELLWAAAKLGLQLQPPTWPMLLAHTCQVSTNMPPYETATAVWALAHLHPPFNVELEVQEILHGCKQKLQAFPPRSLMILTLGLVKLNISLSHTQKHHLVQAAAAHLLPTSSNSNCSSRGDRTGHHRQDFSGRDLCQLVWSFARLGITPPAPVLTAALRASKRHLSVLDWDFITALLRGVGWLRFVPPGPWLLELYDQLYWTVDQLSLGQLCCVIWSLGRLRLVAVPPELLERLLTFATLRCQQVQQDLQQQAGQAPDEALRGTRHHVDSKATAQQHHTFAKHLSLLLAGLAGLKPQLDPQQLQQCRSWVLAVLEVTTPEASKQVAGSLLAAAKLGVQLTAPADRLQVHSAVSVVSSQLSVEHVAQAVAGAVAVAGPPSPLQFQQWLQYAFPGLLQAGVGEVHMLLQACVCAGQQPSQEWWARAVQRMMQLAPTLEGTNCAHQSQLLVDLVLQDAASQAHEHQQHVLQQWGNKGDPKQHSGLHQSNDNHLSALMSQQLAAQQQQAAGAYLAEGVTGAASAGPAIPAHAVSDLMALLSTRVEQLEVQQQISKSSLQRFEHNQTCLLKLMDGS